MVTHQARVGLVKAELDGRTHREHLGRLGFEVDLKREAIDAGRANSAAVGRLPGDHAVGVQAELDILGVEGERSLERQEGTSLRVHEVEHGVVELGLLSPARSHA